MAGRHGAGQGRLVKAQELEFVLVPRPAGAIAEKDSGSDGG